MKTNHCLIKFIVIRWYVAFRKIEFSCAYTGGRTERSLYFNLWSLRWIWIMDSGVKYYQAHPGTCMTNMLHGDVDTIMALNNAVRWSYQGDEVVCRGL